MIYVLPFSQGALSGLENAPYIEMLILYVYSNSAKIN